MKATEKKTKEIIISLSLEVPEEATQEEVATKIGKALEPLADTVMNVSDLAIRTVPRLHGPHDEGGGYETRLWEKATCKVAMDPRDRLKNPEEQIERLLEEAESLNEQTRRLNQAVATLAQRVGGK